MLSNFVVLRSAFLFGSYLTPHNNIGYCGYLQFKNLKRLHVGHFLSLIFFSYLSFHSFCRSLSWSCVASLAESTDHRCELGYVGSIAIGWFFCFGFDFNWKSLSLMWSTLASSSRPITFLHVRNCGYHGNFVVHDRFVHSVCLFWTNMPLSCSICTNINTWLTLYVFNIIDVDSFCSTYLFHMVF